jgi:septal ring factor EnvC (AmiA/AmiB activator)
MYVYFCQLKVFEKKYEDLKQELVDTKERSRRYLQDLTKRKDKEISILNRDLSSLKEESQAKLEEVKFLEPTLHSFL